MTESIQSSLLKRQMKKLGLSLNELPQSKEAWMDLILKIEKTYKEYDEARQSSDNVLAVSLREMELLQAERARLNADVLMDLNANLSLVLQASEMGSWDWDLKTNTVNYDERWCEMIGYAKHEVPQNLQAFQDLVHPDDLGHVMTMASDYIQNKVPRFDIKFRMKHKNGSWSHIQAKGKITRFDENGAPLRFIGTHSDLTEDYLIQKKIEEQKTKIFHQSKLASLGELSAGIAHEVNNPVTVILGTAEVLENFKDQPEKFKSKIDVILRSCRRITKILNGLKKFSRVAEKNQFKLLDLGAIIDEAIVLTEIKAARANTLVTKDCPGVIPVFCDDLGIEQVLINLINNAIDAIKEKDEKWVKISAMTDGDFVVLRVIDSGLTFSVEIEQKIFYPFFTTKGVGDGTGLGLSITKGILDEHGASIALNRSFPNTCFEIKIPLAKNHS